MKSPFISQRLGSSSRQRGVSLLMALVVLVILLMGGLAVMRSMNTSLSSAGNLAFRRDLTSQGEQAVVTALTRFKASGALATAAASGASNAALNYSAVPLATNAQGIPSVLLASTADTAIIDAINDLTGNPADVKIRYVIERLCGTTGTVAALGTPGCIYAPSGDEVLGGSGSSIGKLPPPPSSPLYRLTVRVSGPRNTQVFLQTSFTKPD